MQVWPFKALSGLRENLAWLTSVVQAPAAEQRMALRAEPRCQYDLAYNFTQRDYSAALALLRSADEFLVPGWPHLQRVGVVAPGVGVVVQVDPVDLYLAAGDLALLWQSSELFEAVTVADVSGGDITLEAVTGSYSSARLMPLYEADAPGGLQASRPAGTVIPAKISMRLRECGEPGAVSYDQYRGIDVLTDTPIVSSGSFQQPFSWALDSFDNRQGTPSYTRRHSYPENALTMRWRARERQHRQSLRQWLWSRSGQQRAFWFSSRSADFVAAYGISAVATVLVVNALPSVVDLGRTSFDIEIVTASGAVYWRQVTAVAFGVSEIQLTLDAALGVALAPGDIRRISYLHCMRFSSDSISANHEAAAGMVVSVPLVECPIPV